MSSFYRYINYHSCYRFRQFSTTSTPPFSSSSSTFRSPFVRKTTLVLLSIVALTPSKRSFVYSWSPSSSPSASFSSTSSSSMSRFTNSMGNYQSPLSALVQTSADPKVVKSPSEWKKQLTPLAYEVTRESGTERAFKGIYTDTTDPGIYRCSCCGIELFTSDDKFHSGCGWPAFSLPIDGVKGEKIRYIRDTSHGMERVETRCKNCEAHLGHVFDDGPANKGGLRYCINSVSLTFDKQAVPIKNSSNTDNSGTATVSGTGTSTVTGNK